MLGEAEGLTQIPLLGARLHFLVAPLADWSRPSAPRSACCTSRPAAGRGAACSVTAEAKRSRTLRPRLAVRVTRRGVPVKGAVVSVAGASEVTDERGRATVAPKLGVPGRFAAMAHSGRRRGRSAFVRLGPVAANAAATPTRPAR